MTKRDSTNRDGHSARDVLQAQRCVSDCRGTDSLNQRQRLIKGESLRLVVVREFRKVRIDKLDTAAIDNRPVGSGGHKRGPAAMVRDTDECVVF